MTRQEKAAALREKGYNCAQCVAAAFADVSGLDEKVLLSACSGFGGGMRCGEICGAASGAVMTLGLVFPYSDADDSAAKDRISELTQSFIRRFRDRNGKLTCRELIAQSKKRRCPEYIASAIEIVEEMIEEEKTKENK